MHHRYGEGPTLAGDSTVDTAVRQRNRNGSAADYRALSAPDITLGDGTSIACSETHRERGRSE